MFPENAFEESMFAEILSSYSYTLDIPGNKIPVT